MSLKLIIIVCQNCESQDTMSYIKQVLPADLLTNAFSLPVAKDKKLSEIGLYLNKLIHQESGAAQMEESKAASGGNQNSDQPAAQQMQKQQALAKKKAALLAKMKRK